MELKHHADFAAECPERVCWRRASTLERHVVNGNLPKLRVLALYGQAYDEFVPALLKASLPALTDLDLRRTDIDVDSIPFLTRSPRPGLPNLKRVGLSVNSGREEQYTDWNGAVVWRGEEKMSDSLTEWFVTSTPLMTIGVEA